jgi:hypothetical protein
LGQDYSVLLVIPDFYDRGYVRDLVNLFLVTMGFKQVSAQQVDTLLTQYVRNADYKP